MVEVSKQVIMLTDSSKMGVDTFCKVCPLEKLDVVVSEQPIPEAWRNHQKLGKLNWIQA